MTDAFRVDDVRPWKFNFVSSRLVRDWLVIAALIPWTDGGDNRRRHFTVEMMRGICK